jgi:hypothetical protein
MVCGALAAPLPSRADTAVRRVAALDGDHAGVSNPDRNASGRAVIKVHRSHGTLCFRIAFEDMTAFHADIRRTRDHEVVKELYHEEPTDRPLEGCVQGLSERVLQRLRTRPGAFYVYLAEYQSLGQPSKAIAGALGRA